jgi:hypothetical protein
LTGDTNLEQDLVFQVLGTRKFALFDAGERFKE